jgi:hypothetical protein
MKIKAAFSVLLVVALVSVLPGSFGSASAKGKKAAGPVVVGTDPADDWGSAAGVPQPVGDAIGQELVEASIGMADAKTINFVFKLNSLPPWGGMPEVSRYNWDFNVDGDAYQLTGGFTEYLRGVCNPLQTGSCPPPQDPGQTPFFLRQGPCTVGAECFLRGITHATFDPAAATITVPVPLELIKAKPGSKINPGASSFGPSIYAAPAAMVSNASLPSDVLTVTGIYTIPKGK